MNNEGKFGIVPLYHRVMKMRIDDIYHNLDIDDLFMAAILNRHFNIEDVKPLHAGFFSNRENSDDTEYGFIDFKPKNTNVLGEAEILNTFESVCVKLDDVSMENRVIIYNVDYTNNIINKQRYTDIINKNPKLALIPVYTPGHFTLLALEPQTKRAYYYDSMGRKNDDIKNWCENTLGYSYRYNTKWLQTDEVSCGPSIVNFAMHAVDCIKNNRKITAEGMPKFGCGMFSSIAEMKEIANIRRWQKNLLYFKDENGKKMPFQATSCAKMEKYQDNYLRLNDQKKAPILGQLYEFPHCGARPGPYTNKNLYTDPDTENTVYSTKYYEIAIKIQRRGTAIGVLLGIITGAALGVIAQKTEISTVLTELLKVTSQQADIIFTVSTCIAMGAILGLIGNLSARAVDSL